MFDGLTKNDVFSVKEIARSAGYEELTAIRVLSAVGLNIEVIQLNTQ